MNQKTKELIAELEKKGISFPECLRLIREGADVNAKSKYHRTVLMESILIGVGAVNTVKEVLSLSPDIEAGDNDNWTALMCACAVGHESAINILLDLGANIHAKDTDGWSMLIVAIDNAVDDTLLGVAKLLIDRGSDISQLTNTGSSVYDYARYSNEFDLIELLDIETDRRERAGSEEREGSVSKIFGIKR